MSKRILSELWKYSLTSFKPGQTIRSAGLELANHSNLEKRFTLIPDAIQILQRIPFEAERVEGYFIGSSEKIQVYLKDAKIRFDLISDSGYRTTRKEMTFVHQHFQDFARVLREIGYYPVKLDLDYNSTYRNFYFDFYFNHQESKASRIEVHFPAVPDFVNRKQTRNEQETPRFKLLSEILKVPATKTDAKFARELKLYLENDVEKVRLELYKYRFPERLSFELTPKFLELIQGTPTLLVSLIEILLNHHLDLIGSYIKANARRVEVTLIWNNYPSDTGAYLVYKRKVK